MSNAFLRTRRDEILHNAVTKLSPQPMAAAIITIDGLSIAAYPIYGDNDIRREEDRVSGMSAAMLSLGERISDVLLLGQMRETIIRGDDGIVIQLNSGEWVLTAKFKGIVALDSVLSQLQVAIKEIDKLL